MNRNCSCHLSAPCQSCLDMTEEEIDALVNEPSPPLPPPPAIAREPWTPRPVPPRPAYKVDEMRSEGKIGVGWRCYMRSGTIEVWSSWWGVDDGSCQAEADAWLLEKVRASLAAKEPA